jgi:hypothetical protein
MKRKAVQHVDRNRSVIDVFEHVMLGWLPNGTGSRITSSAYNGRERRMGGQLARGTHCPARRRGD